VRVEDPVAVPAGSDGRAGLLLAVLSRDEAAAREAEAMRSWVITVPKTVLWEDYLEEVRDAAEWQEVLNFRVRGFPKEMQVGDRCYIVHNGKVRGWMEICGLAVRDGFRCHTTGKDWPAGKYIQRSGQFHFVDGPGMNGFRGVRRFEWDSKSIGST
jgi:hypothetical protein